MIQPAGIRAVGSGGKGTCFDEQQAASPEPQAASRQASLSAGKPISDSLRTSVDRQASWHRQPARILCSDLPTFVGLAAAMPFPEGWELPASSPFLHDGVDLLLTLRIERVATQQSAHTLGIAVRHVHGCVEYDVQPLIRRLELSNER